MKTPDRILRILKHPYVALALRVYIGGLFVYASLHKINHAAEFAEIIAGYQMVPYWAVNIMAASLPWVELVCGALLITGIRARSAAVLIGFLLVLFTCGIVVNLTRGTPVSCGCFSALSDEMSFRTILRDLVWAAMTLHVFLYDRLFHLDRKLFVERHA